MRSRIRWASILGVVGMTFLSGCESDNPMNSTTPTPNRVDRMGMPAIATAVITSKDAYNADDPAGDAAGNWVPEITANLTALHAALDDDLTGAGLTPASVDEAVAQAAPLVVPDVIGLMPGAAAGFPNGRLLTDPVIDITLALVLLKLSGFPAPHTVTDLVGVLNPTTNDLPFDAAFPYLAAPHTP